jgi:hypothetical protein
VLRDDAAMRNCRGLFSTVVAAAVLQCHGAAAQDDDGDRRNRDDRGGRENRNDSRDSNCTASLSDVELRGTLNVTARCQLIGSDIRGDVIIFAGGSLLARNTRIRGSIEASRGDFVELVGVRVDRNISLRELVGDSSRIESSDLRGNVVLTSNRSRFTILDNEIRRDLGAFGNTGGLQIAGNSIDGDLLCTGNVPAPTLLGNRIDGDAGGQCGAPREPAAEPTPPRPTPTPTPAPAPTSPPATPAPSGGSSPPASTPPSAPTQPTTTPEPTATPEPTSPPATAPPAAAAPPPPTPPADATPPEEELDDGGAGAIDWSIVAVLLPLVAWRRRKRTRAISIA